MTPSLVRGHRNPTTEPKGHTMSKRGGYSEYHPTDHPFYAEVPQGYDGAGDPIEWTRYFPSFAEAVEHLRGHLHGGDTGYAGIDEHRVEYVKVDNMIVERSIFLERWCK